MNARILFPSLILTLITWQASGDTVKDRPAAVRDDKAAMEKDARWLYNDIDKGFAEATKSGKPLLVVLRCVPCLSCIGLDAQVLADKSLEPLLEQFVCLRVINANTLDLSRFQFDYDLSLTTMMFNGDGTVYGRFGSWTHQKSAQEKATAGFVAALKGALAIHKDYPANKATLAGKQGAPISFKTTLEIPSLAGKYTKDLDWEGRIVQSCVHCHQIGDAMRTALREKRKPIPDNMIYPQPPPETIGLTLAEDTAALVTAVAENSPAAKAGIKAGDEIVAIAGQPPVSLADVSWALHRAPVTGSLPVVVKREGGTKPLQIPLANGWRQQADISRRVGTWDMRAMALGGLLLEDVPDSERGELDLGKNVLALRAKHVGEYDHHAAAKKAGWQKGDVMVEIDGLSNRQSEGELIGYLLQKYQPGASVKATVLRGGKRLPLSLPMQ